MRRALLLLALGACSQHEPRVVGMTVAWVPPECRAIIAERPSNGGVNLYVETNASIGKFRCWRGSTTFETVQPVIYDWR